LLEILIYAGLVAAYFYLVLVYLGEWLGQLYHDNRRVYAFLALALIIVQGVVLEIVTSFLLRLIKSRIR
jgi:hypothetical protein